MQLSLLSATLPTDSVVTRAMDIAREAYDNGEAKNTRRVRESQLAQFAKWRVNVLGEKLSDPVTENTLALHIGWMVEQGKKRATIDQRVNAIGKLCESQGWPDPRESREVRQMLRGAQRMTARPKSKEPLTPQDIRIALQADVLTKQERALVLVGFVSGLRVGNLCSITWADITFHERGAVICIERSKTDQTGEGRFVAIPATGTEFCPVRALQELPKIGSMFPVFGVKYLDERKVRILVKEVAELAGKDPALYSSHSFRHGMATTAYRSGAERADIQNGLWHTKADTTDRYIAPLEALNNPAYWAVAKALG